MPRRSDAERNRRNVIEAAIELFSRDPGTKIQAIADASGVGRTTVYRHFPTRDDLLEAVLGEVMARARRMAAAASVVPGDPRTSIANLSAALLDIGFSFGALITTRDGESQAFEGAKDAEDSPTRRFLREARARGELRPDLPEEWMRTSMQTVALTAIEEVEAGVVARRDAYGMVAETLAAILVAPSAEAEPSS